MSWDATRYDEAFAFVPALGAAVLDLLDPQPGERVLDLGCGSGELTAQIAACGAHVVGVDSSTEMLERARYVSRISMCDSVTQRAWQLVSPLMPSSRTLPCTG